MEPFDAGRGVRDVSESFVELFAGGGGGGGADSFFVNLSS